MPKMDVPAVIIARFLKANHYHETLDAFIKEAGLPQDAGETGKGDLTIEKILEEKNKFDLSLSFERLGTGEEDRGWSNQAPMCPTIVEGIPSSANLLHVSIERWKIDPHGDTSQILIATTGDRRMRLFQLDSDFTLLSCRDSIQDSSIISVATCGDGCPTTFSAGMSGQLIYYDHKSWSVLEERRDHKKYVVKIVVEITRGHPTVYTAGWDNKIFCYLTNSLSNNPSATGYLSLGPPSACITLPTNPETITPIKNPSGIGALLVVTRRDSTCLHFYAVPEFESSEGSGSSELSPREMQLLGTQNLAPHSNAWITFSPSAVAICPTDRSLIAVATSSEPHMKLIIACLLIPRIEDRDIPIPNASTQAAQSRAALAVQDREDAAILVNISTTAPQTPYSTPQICWRPDGSGVWVNGDDGVIRGFEAKTGKLVATLKDGHEAGSKIRSIWAGMVDVEGKKEEWLVSGGFDKKLIVWKPER